MIKKLFKTLWTIINTSRKVLLNVIFLLILFAFIGATGQEEIKIPESTALVLNLNGDIVEQKREVDPMSVFMNEALGQQEEKPEVLLADVLKVINKAAADNRVRVLVLHLHRMNNAGITKLADIANAIEKFKAQDKQVIAIGDLFTQDQYYLASYADKIWLNPNGWMILDGYGRYRMYFKSELDKLEISQHVFRVGTFKSALEPYMRDDMSDAAKEANTAWLNDLWSKYKADVAAQRNFDVSNFDETTDALITKLRKANGNIAEYALANGWVDELKTRKAIRESITEIVGSDESENTFSQISFDQYLKATTNPFDQGNPISDKVAVIVAKGTILDGTQKPGTIGGDSTAKLLERARNDDSVKAVVLRVDSPGGSAYASEIIRQEVDLLKKSGKPVVASMGTYAASGGYWISASANKIYASPTTITGSIGIFGFLMTFEKSLSKLGINTDGVGTTEIAGFDLSRPLTKGMGDIFQLGIERGYQDFISLVAENRNMTLEEVDNIAQGRVWSGIKAKEIGLVDELGSLEDAVNEAASIAGLQDFDVKVIEKELTPREQFLKDMFGQASAYLPEPVETTKGPVEMFINKVVDEAVQINKMNDPKGIYSLCLHCEIH